ncbi:MAG: metalloregulator ArsR/SmtB family transcription factor [Clostridiales bacterium]|nr:metalloregulator ArsR/SmtB family transcription factor [Clostridiales bacterium]
MTELFKALGDENRLRLLNVLDQKALCVCEIEVLLGMSQSNASRHLSKLRAVGILSSEKDAQWVHYKISDDFIKLNRELYLFLKEGFQKGESFINDLQRLEIYTKKGLNCQYIANDKDYVLREIDIHLKKEA